MTPVKVILEQLDSFGVSIVIDGDKLRATPTAALTPVVRDLLVANRTALLAALKSPDLRALEVGPDIVVCANCRHFTAKVGSRPDGWCRRYRAETWRKVEFRCAGFEAGSKLGTLASPA